MWNINTDCICENEEEGRYKSLKPLKLLTAASSNAYFRKIKGVGYPKNKNYNRKIT